MFRSGSVIVGLGEYICAWQCLRRNMSPEIKFKALDIFNVIYHFSYLLALKYSYFKGMIFQALLKTPSYPS